MRKAATCPHCGKDTSVSKAKATRDKNAIFWQRVWLARRRHIRDYRKKWEKDYGDFFTRQIKDPLVCRCGASFTTEDAWEAHDCKEAILPHLQIVDGSYEVVPRERTG